MTETVYVAGPMEGLVDHNFPAFFAAEETLRAAGHLVVNPARLNPEWHKMTREQCMRNDLKHLVSHCTVIALLPGWEISKGATLELAVAEGLGMQVWELPAAVKAFRPRCEEKPLEICPEGPAWEGRTPGGADVISEPAAGQVDKDHESERLAALGVVTFVLVAAIVAMVLAVAMLGGCCARRGQVLPEPSLNG